MKQLKKWMMVGITALALSAQAGGIAWSFDSFDLLDIFGDRETTELLCQPTSTLYMALFDYDTDGGEFEGTCFDMFFALRAGTFDPSTESRILGSMPFFDYVHGNTYYMDHPALTSGDAHSLLFFAVLPLTEAGKAMFELEEDTWYTFAFYVVPSVLAADSSATAIPMVVSVDNDLMWDHLVPPSVIPEPLTTGLALAGVALLLAQRRRK